MVVRIAAAILLTSVVVPAAAADVPSLAVIPFQTRSLAREKVEILDHLVLAEVSSVGKFRVISPADVNAMLGLEKMKEALGCDDLSCAAEIGGALGVTYMVTGTADVLGNQLLLTGTLLNIKETRAEARKKVAIPNDENRYIQAVEQLVAELFAIDTPGRKSSTTSPPEGSTGSATEPEKRAHRLGFVVGGRFGQYRRIECDEPEFSEWACTQEFYRWIPSLAYQWQHHEYLAFRLAGGLGIGEFMGFREIDGLWGVFSVGEEVTVPIVRSASPWPTVSNMPFSFVGSVDLELEVGPTMMARVLGGAGFRIWWFTALAHVGVPFGPHVEGRDARIDNGSGRIDKPSGVTYGFTAGTTFAF